MRISSYFLTAIFAVILMLGFSQKANAETAKCVEKTTGTQFDSIVQNESKNICVGTGLRTKRVLFVGVQVYAAAFYLDEKSLAELKNHKGDKIKEMIEGRYARIIKMRFLRDVSADKLKEGFLEGLRYSMPNPSAKTTEQLNAFLATMKDVKKGDEIIIYFGYYVTGELKSDLVATKNIVVDNKELSVGLLNIWFDDKPAIPELKKDVLKSLEGK